MKVSEIKVGREYMVSIGSAIRRCRYTGRKNRAYNESVYPYKAKPIYVFNDGTMTFGFRSFEIEDKVLREVKA